MSLQLSNINQNSNETSKYDFYDEERLILPRELILQICTLLPKMSDIAHFSLTCKRFHRLLNDKIAEVKELTRESAEEKNLLETRLSHNETEVHRVTQNIFTAKNVLDKAGTQLQVTLRLPPQTAFANGAEIDQFLNLVSFLPRNHANAYFSAVKEQGIDATQLEACVDFLAAAKQTFDNENTALKDILSKSEKIKAKLTEINQLFLDTFRKAIKFSDK